jgi:hypothetical protein
MTELKDATMTISSPQTKPANSHTVALFAITLPSFLLAAVCFVWYGQTGEVALLLLGLVTFGMAYDFMSHIIGLYLDGYDRFLRWYTRINFAALCFGIPFTAFAGTFVMAQVVPDGISAQLVNNYLPILHGSVIFGALYLFARYKKVHIEGAVEYVLDKTHAYTKLIFLTRRVLLAASLVIGITVVIDGWQTDFWWWSLLFGGVFISSVPLHIMHKQIPSMLSELITQLLAVYASWLVFVH